MKKPILSIVLIIAVVIPSFSQRILKDIAQGTDNARIFATSTFASGDTLFFRASDSRAGDYKYYSTTGTGVSTKPLKSDNSGPFGFANGGNIRHFKIYNKIFILNENDIYIVKNDSINLVKLFPSPQHSFFFIGAFEINNQANFLYFNTSTGSVELWKSDGTESGTILYKSITPTPRINQWNESFLLNGKYFFTFNDSPTFNNSSTKVLITDGTSAGTTIIGNHKIGGHNFQTLGGKVYFAMPVKVDDNYWRVKLGESQGDSASTKKVLTQIDGDTSYTSVNLFSFKNDLYFYSYTNWQATIRKFEASSQTAPSISRVVNYSNLLSADKNRIYYNNSENGSMNFYENNGSLASEKFLFSVPDRGASFYNLQKGSSKYYLFEQQIEEGGSLQQDAIYWVYDGSTTKKITELNPNIKLGLYHNFIGVVGDLLYFSASDNLHGYELWRTDGTVAGTFIVKDINTQIASSNPKILFGNKDQLYFMADDITHGRELWRTNGITTSLFADLNLGYNNSHVSSSVNPEYTKFKSSHLLRFPQGYFQIRDNNTFNYINFLPASIGTNLYEFKDSLYFIGTDGNLWKTSGTAIGTKKAIHLDSTNNGIGNSGYQILNNIGNDLYFTSNFNGTLWKTNGTKVGTKKIIEFNISEFPFYYSPYYNYYSWALSNLLIFERRKRDSNKIELWGTDGTLAGTYKLVGSDHIEVFGVFNNKIYFKNGDGTLWKTDGSIAGTTQASTQNFVSGKQLGDKFYFVEVIYEPNSVKYYELDKNNNLKLLTTINEFTNEGFGYPSGFVNIDNRYLLNYISTPSHQHFILTDGNVENTKKAFSLKNSTPIDNDYYFNYHNKKIYFTALDSLKGQELWIWDFECPDGYTIRDAINKDSTVVYGKNIWGQNIVGNNKTVTYDAKNSIILKPGFEAQKGTVFKTKLIGCTNNAVPNTTEDTSPIKNEPLVKVNVDKPHYPQLMDFLYYLPNKHLKDIYERAKLNNLIPVSWNIVTEKDIYRLDLKIGTNVIKGFLPKKN